MAHTGDLRTVRIPADDGFVTISCRRAERTMSLTKTDRSAAGPTVAQHMPPDLSAM